MLTLFFELFFAVITFLLFKIVIVIINKIFKRITRAKNKSTINFDFLVSFALQFVFIFCWFIAINIVAKNLCLSRLEFYVSFCLVGFAGVIWSYFSWDAERIIVRPKRASREEKRLKKIFVYSLVLIFAVWQGYYQTWHAIDVNVEIDSVFLITNYSIVVTTIAFDRLMNQIFID